MPSAAPRRAESHDQLMHPGSLVRVQAERLPRRAERDARKKSKRRIVGSMSRPIDLKEQATRSTGASEIAAGPTASKKPKRMVKGTMSCELTAAAVAETTRPLKRKYPNVPSTQERATSIFKGVGLHSKSKLWEAHIWLVTVFFLDDQAPTCCSSRRCGSVANASFPLFATAVLAYSLETESSATETNGIPSEGPYIVSGVQSFQPWEFRSVGSRIVEVKLVLVVFPQLQRHQVVYPDSFVLSLVGAQVKLSLSLVFSHRDRVHIT